MPRGVIHVRRKAPTAKDIPLVTISRVETQDSSSATPLSRLPLLKLATAAFEHSEDPNDSENMAEPVMEVQTDAELISSGVFPSPEKRRGVTARLISSVMLPTVG